MKRAMAVVLGSMMLFSGGMATAVPPIGAGASESGRWFNVRDYGAKGDGKANDLPAIQKTIDTAPDGSVIYFPRGTYLIDGEIRGFVVTGRHGLRFEGEGALSIIRRVNVGMECRNFGTFRDCSDITVTHLSFDNRAIRAFGGLSFFSSKRIWICRNHFFDSDRQPQVKKGYDRYAIVFGIGEQPSEDLWISENLIESLQVEIDLARRVHIVNNRSLHPEYSTGFGWFSLRENAMCEDYEIVGNVVVDPIVLGINATLDGERNGSVIRRVLIARNLIACEKRVPSLACIMVGGLPERPIKAVGVKWEGIAVIDNVVWYDPTLPRPGKKPAIRVVTAAGTEDLRGVRVAGNQVLAHGKLDSWGLELACIKDSLITDNAVEGAAQGFLFRDQFARNLIHDNRVTDVAGEGFKLIQSGGDNKFLNNFSFGKVGVPFSASDVRPSDTIRK